MLPVEKVVLLASSPDAGKVVGRRDRAMLLLGSGPGFRPVDIVALRLQEIDWRQGQITLAQHKTDAVLTLPLLADVGEAIASYLLNDRPAGAVMTMYSFAQEPRTLPSYLRTVCTTSQLAPWSGQESALSPIWDAVFES